MTDQSSQNVHFSQSVSSEIIALAKEVFDDSDDLVRFAEELFGSKARDLTDEEQRQFALAKKAGALVWTPLPTVGGKVKIQVLSYLNKPLDK